MSIQHKKRRLHGMSKTITYRSWTAMMGRCVYGTSGASKNYLHKGITVCEEWKEFENFYRDMGERSEGHSIDRVNPDMGYFKENCRWLKSALNSKRIRRKKRISNLALGVSMTKSGKYVASIKINKISYYLGRYETEKDASDKYLEMYKEWNGNYPEFK